MKNRVEHRIKLFDREQEIREKKIRYIDKDANQMINTFRDNINRINNRFEIVDLLSKHKKTKEANDILRFQIVFVMSSLDFFMHEIYSYGLLKIFKKETPKTRGYNNYKVPLKLLEQALYDSENIDEYLKQAFIDINDSYTFMSSGRIRVLLNVITSEDEFSKVERALKNKKIIDNDKKLDNILDDIYERRNKIAHQTDIDHGDDDKNIIARSEVEYYIDVTTNFVEELYKIICLNKQPQ